MKTYKAYIFDMDGTVLDTLTDLNHSLNHALEVCGHRHDYSPEITGAFFGSGITVSATRALAYEAGWPLESLVQVGSADDPISPTVDPSAVAEIEDVFRPYYAIHCTDSTGPYPGIPETIRALRARGLLTAVVSNKPDNAVQELVRDQFDGLFDYSIGEQKGIARKPSPDMVLRCLEILGVSPSESVYIGDSEIDLQTAANTGLDCIAVDWGFRSRAFLETSGATRIISRAEELL